MAEHNSFYDAEATLVFFVFILNILFSLFCVIYLRNPCDIFSLCWSDLIWSEIK